MQPMSFLSLSSKAIVAVLAVLMLVGLAEAGTAHVLGAPAPQQGQNDQHALDTDPNACQADSGKLEASFASYSRPFAA
jgi:hypothetical protein